MKKKTIYNIIMFAVIAAIAAAADGLITHPENYDIDWTPDEFVSDWNDLHRGEEPLK